MDLFKVAANAIGLHKQDNTNGTCAAGIEQIIFQLGNNTVKWNKWNDELFKVHTVNAWESCKQNDTDGIRWWHWPDQYVVET